MAKKTLKWLGRGALIIGLLVAGGVGFIFTAFPKVNPAPNLNVSLTPERLERGKYLAEHVALCMDCHSQRDFSRFTAPNIPGTEGKGGDHFDHKFGIPGDIVPSNITPAALSSWSDGELYRAIVEGVSKDGRALFPLMPYQAFAQMTKEDIYSIIAYVRSLPSVPVEEPAKAELDFPLNLIVRTMPKPAELSDTHPKQGVEYGKYLVTAAACIECHSPRDKGAPVPGKEFSGGNPFELPNGFTVHSANITPDAETGIGSWSREQFVARFKKIDARPVGHGEAQTIMPWSQLSGMSEEDLGSIYDYLRTLPAVKNKVIAFANPSPGKEAQKSVSAR